MKALILIGFLIVSFLSFSCSEDGKEGIAPENNLKIPAHIKTDSPITKESFFTVINQIEKTYLPIMKEMGETLHIIKDWENATVNAYAKKSGGKSIVHMFGGLARHPKMTEDGFALVVCHEIGHHIGGAPKIGSSRLRDKDHDTGHGFTRVGASWASNEGQADYWATLKCARKSWQDDDNFSIISDMKIPEIVKEKCEKTHGTGHDYALCQRSAMAGFALANTLADLRKSPPTGGIPPLSGVEAQVSGYPQFETPDLKVVRRTNHNHPAAQCRLDTYFMGAICAISDTEEVSQKDPNQGVCSRYKKSRTGSSMASDKKGGGDEPTDDENLAGVRPRCWYKPSLRVR